MSNKKVPYDCSPPSYWDSAKLATENAELTEMLYKMCKNYGSIFDPFGEEHPGELWFDYAETPGSNNIHNWYQEQLKKRKE